MTVYYVDGDVGNDANNGLAEGAGNAWATIDKGMNTVIHDDKVWIKDSATYTETITIDTLGWGKEAIIFEGYTSATGDKGRITLVGKLVPSNGDNGYCFRNIIFDGDGTEPMVVAGSSSTWNITWRNCVFRNYTQHGIKATSGCIFYECEWDFVGAWYGFYSLKQANDNEAVVFINCRFRGPPVPGGMAISYAGNTVCYNCIFSTAGIGIRVWNANPATSVSVFNCTFDGGGLANSTAIYVGPSSGHFIVNSVNNIIYDCSIGIEAGAADRNILVHNLLNSNVVDYVGGGSDQEGGQSGAPDFVDEAGGNYALNPTSPAVATGTDYSADEMDMGAIQTVAPDPSDYPATADVEEGVTFDSGNQTGTFAVPAQGDVESRVDYGDSAEFTGTFTEPGVANVASGVQYGGGGTEFTGELVAAAGGSGLAIKGDLVG